VLDRLWSRLWLAVFLATVIPLATFLVTGLLLIQRNVEGADIDALGRQARTLGVIVAGQSPGQRAAVQDAVESVGRSLSIVPVGSLSDRLPDAAIAEVETTGFVQGRVRTPDDRIYAAALHGDEVVLLERPYETPVLDWGPWVGRVLIGGLLTATCAIVVSLFLARAIARPVDRVVRASQALATGETPISIPPEGPQELRSLIVSFNTMSSDLKRAQERERTFLLSVSHELRTPVAAVQGFAEAIQEGVIDTEKAVGFILAESRRLERLIGDLLDLARLGAGRFDVRPQALDLRRIALDAAERCAAAADSLTTRVIVLSAPESPAHGDPDRVLQITSNLIENALRLSPPGSVVTVETGPGSVTVADSGPGLSGVDLEHAFDRFFLYDRHKGDRPVGTGLGLALVRELAQAMGGEVGVAAAPGGGTEFSVRLPVSEGVSPPSGRAQSGGPAERPARPLPPS
jgi:two-component system sensor histidine kinase BaeS